MYLMMRLLSNTNLLVLLISVAIIIDSSSILILVESMNLGEDHIAMTVRHEQWMSQHGRKYEDDAEKDRRFHIFKANVEYIEAMNKFVNNSHERKYKLGINQFADLTNEEFRASLLSNKSIDEEANSMKLAKLFRYENARFLPSTMDWRDHGAVTPVKVQRKCGACWVFSAVASIEGLTKLKTGKLLSLSEQEIIDCDHVNIWDNGCKSGTIQGAFDFTIDNGGLSTEANYPYKASDGKCNAAKSTSKAGKIKSYEFVPSKNELALLKAVAHQPISAAINIDGPDFQFYSSGVFDGDCGTKLEHGVALIGYGATIDGTKYWIVKNSWGSLWGEGGYIRMRRDVGAREGLCGIAIQPIYPTID